jgi:uncharacterized membrane protein SpoIIM required for sporulation
MSAQTIARQFRERREPEWQRLEAILQVAERRSVRALSDEDLLALPILYRGALSSLSLARETSLDLELVTYLEGLCARAYFFVYGVRTTAGSQLGAFFRRDWPDAVRGLWRETLASALFFAIGIAAAYLLVAHDPNWYDALVPGGLAGGRNFSADADSLRETLYHQEGGNGLSFFATFLFTHNTQVSLMCFALGFAFGVPTAMLLVHNGTALGAMFALFQSRGLGFEFAGWLSIHGTTELFAIVLAGASGFRIGWALVFPGAETRLAAATRAGRSAAFVMVGVIIMLLCAGLLEGYGRQLVLNDLARYGVGGVMLLLWLAYFYIPRSRADG